MAALSSVASGRHLERNLMSDRKKSITFMGKSFYLDLPHNKPTQLLSTAIFRRGGVIESFLSRDVDYVVTGNRKSADITNGGSGGRKENRSKHPAAENVETAPCSRGKQLLKKVVQSQECGDVLSSARSWGVCILRLDEVLEYLECLTQRHVNRPPSGKGPGGAGKTLKVGKLKSPFLKIEDQSRKYRPLHCSFSNFPECSLISSDRSPFETARTNNSTHKDRDPRDQDEGEKPQNWEKMGYCECCQMTYPKLSEHLISEQHCLYALKATNYKVIDDIISLIDCDFAPLPYGFRPSEEQSEDEAPPQSSERPLVCLEKEDEQQGESKDLLLDLVVDGPTEGHSLVLPERHVEQDATCPMENHSLGLSQEPPAENLVIDPAQEPSRGLHIEDNGPQRTASTTNALVPCDLPLERAHVGLVTEVSWYSEEAGLTSVYTVQSIVLPPAPGLDQHLEMDMENSSVQPQLFLGALEDPPFALAQGALRGSDENDQVQAEPPPSTGAEPQIINAVLLQTNTLLGDELQVMPSTRPYSEYSQAPTTGGECTLQHMDAASSVEAPVVDQHQHVLLVSSQNHLLLNPPCDIPAELTNSLSIDQLTLAPWHPSAEGNVMVLPSTTPSVDVQDQEPALPNTDCCGGKRKHCCSPSTPPAKRQPLPCQPLPMWAFHHLPSSTSQPTVPVFNEWMDRDCSSRAAEDEGTTFPALCFNPKTTQYDASSESDWDSQLVSQRHNNPYPTAHFGELRTAQVSLDESWYGKQLCSVLAHEQTLGSPSAAQTVTLSHTSYDLFLSGAAS